MTAGISLHQPSRGVSHYWRAHQTDLLLVSMTFIWGLNFSVTKIALRAFSPIAFNTLRFIIATSFLLAVLRRRDGGIRVDRRDLMALVILGVLGHGVYQVFFIEGLAHTTAANSSLLMATVPIFVALLSAALGIERVGAQRWLGILLSFGGIILITLGANGRIDLSSSHLLGDGLMLGGAITWAVYTVASKPLLARYSPLYLTAITMVPGTLVWLAIGLPAMMAQDWTAPSLGAWGGLLYSAIFSVGVAFLIWFNGVQKIGNARTAVYSNGTPVFATLLAWLILGERMTWLQILGAVVILVGVALVRREDVSRRAATSAGCEPCCVGDSA